MPLPDGAVLSLQVQSNLGNAVQSKPKQAMIVRMSAETLEALEAFPNHPQMAVDFGDNPGIYIGETFFPMRPQKEGSPHELYLRAASAAKPMAPLKLYANVIGKFIVERQLMEKVTQKVRQQTMAAKQQHTERQAIHLDKPLIPSGSKLAKRKTPGSGTVVKKTVVPTQRQVPSSSTMAARKVSPLPQNPPSTKAGADVRRRLVHCLAISARLADDAVKMVAGANCSAQSREDLLALLDEIAEQQTPAKKGDKSPRPWTLKPQTWTEVRPYEWPKLPEAERTAMARQARLVFKALKIPETDPAWNHVRYRNTGPTIPQPVAAPPPMAASSSNRSSSSAQAEGKRPAISSKDTKSKPKPDTTRSKGEIQMKDESTKATVSRVNAIKRAEAERSSTPSDTSSTSKSIPPRRLPGSGYQAKKSPQPTSSAERSSTPRPSVPASLPPKPVTAPPHTGGSIARKTIPTMPPKPTKRDDDSDRERDREYERIREREREHREKEKELERQRIEWEREKEKVEMEKREAEKREKARLKEREERREEKRKEREREEMEQERRLREKERERERLAKEKAASGTAIKRKTAIQDSGDASPDPAKAPIPKRRKLDDAASTTPSSSASKVRDPGLPKKPVQEPSPVPRLKMKKEPSPLPPPRASTATQGSTTKPERSRSNGPTKIRRKSPIYTSSEDEGEIPQPRKRNPSPPPVSDRSASDQSMEKQPQTRHRHRASYPTDPDALRAIYEDQYTDYVAAFSQVVTQKRKIEAALNGDTEAEAYIMEPDDIEKLAAEHKSRKAELEHITQLYLHGPTPGAGGSSD